MEEKKKRYWGIGATHDKKPVANDFIRNEIVSVNWDEKQAVTLHEILKNHVKKDDIIFIKSYSPSNGLYIKAVGVIEPHEPKNYNPKKGLKVRWNWHEKDKRKWKKFGLKTEEEKRILRDKYNVRSITLFEEFNPDIIRFLNSKL